MDTINISANGHSASFSKKSVTIDGKEFLYSGISSIKHSSAKHVYLFKYEGNMQPLFYNESETKIVGALFKKIVEMNAKRVASSTPKEATADAVVPVKEATADTEAKAEEATADAEDKTEEASADAEDKTEEASADAEDKAEEATAAAEDKAEEATAAAEDKTEEATSDAEDKTEDASVDAEATAEDASAAIVSADAVERKKRLKKALLVLVIIIVVFIGAGIAYFFFIGPSNDASNNETVDGTHQYNDIEEMIEEMQN